MRATHLARLAVAVAACAALATPAGAAPQWPRTDRDTGREWQDRRGGEAFNRGVREGVREGEEDARRGRASDVRRSDAWRDADRGYDRNDGPRGQYRQEFRRGFEQGYREGYERARNTGFRRNGGGRFNNPAEARGYSDGFEKGNEDRRDRDRFDPTRHKDYRKADKGYEDRYGSKERYRDEYREGFRRGYEDGFRQPFGRR